MNFKATEVGYIAGTPYVGAVVDMYAGPGNGYRGEFMAWDLVRQKKIWAIQENFPVWSGTVATAGGVVFYGTMDRWFKAVDAESGEILWQFRVDSGIIGQPITYQGPDGRQYVAVAAGVGGAGSPRMPMTARTVLDTGARLRPARMTVGVPCPGMYAPLVSMT